MRLRRALLDDDEENADAEGPSEVLGHRLAHGVDGDASGRQVDREVLRLDRLKLVIANLKAIRLTCVDEVRFEAYLSVDTCN